MICRLEVSGGKSAQRARTSIAYRRPVEDECHALCAPGMSIRTNRGYLSVFRRQTCCHVAVNRGHDAIGKFRPGLRTAATRQHDDGDQQTVTGLTTNRLHSDPPLVQFQRKFSVRVDGDAGGAVDGIGSPRLQRSGPYVGHAGRLGNRYPGQLRYLGFARKPCVLPAPST